MRAIEKWLALGVVSAMLASGTALADDNGKSGIGGDAEPAGLYSGAQLMNASVYAKDESTRLGGISDVMFDNDMTIQAFVVETRGEFGLAGKSYVVLPDEVSVATRETENETRPEYRVTLNMDAEGLASRPVYSESWWNTTRMEARKAWQQTQDAASSAWTSVKEGTRNLIDDAENADGAEADDTTTDETR